jgi:hypothetical protein
VQKRTYTTKKANQQHQLQQQQQQQQHQLQQHEVTSIVTTGGQTLHTIPQAQIVQAQPNQARAVDISFAPANVHPEMSKMPAGFSIFQVNFSCVILHLLARLKDKKTQYVTLTFLC